MIAPCSRSSDPAGGAPYSRWGMTYRFARYRRRRTGLPSCSHTVPVSPVTFCCRTSSTAAISMRSPAPWLDCEPCHSQPDGTAGVNADGDLTHSPDYPTASQTCARLVPERLLLHHYPDNFAQHRHRGPPSSCLCGYLTPPSSPSIGIRLAPFAFPCPSSLVSTPRPIASVDSGFSGVRGGQQQGRGRLAMTSLISLLWFLRPF